MLEGVQYGICGEKAAEKLLRDEKIVGRFRIENHDPETIQVAKTICGAALCIAKCLEREIDPVA